MALIARYCSRIQKNRELSIQTMFKISRFGNFKTADLMVIFTRLTAAVAPVVAAEVVDALAAQPMIFSPWGGKEKANGEFQGEWIPLNSFEGRTLL